jgi:hypothetical protein
LEQEARQRRKRTRRIIDREEDDKPEPLKRPRLTVSLTKREIIEDFIKITGKKPSLKPKKNNLEAWVSAAAGRDRPCTVVVSEKVACFCKLSEMNDRCWWRRPVP